MGITQQRSLQGETAVLNRLIQLGYEVLIPWNRSLGYDLAYFSDKEKHSLNSQSLIRVQCKFAWLSKDNACLIFNTAAATEWGRKTHNYHGLAEVFGVYSPDTGKIYMVTVAETGKGSHMMLRLTPPKNNQVKNIKWAANYEI